MVKILIYGYSHGITSSRALERRCQDDIAFRFLTAQAAPDFVAINRFRARHGAALKELFTQSLTLCAQAGLVSLGRVAWMGRSAGQREPAPGDELRRMVRAEGELAAEWTRYWPRRSGSTRLRTPRTGRTAAVMSSRSS